MDGPQSFYVVCEAGVTAPIARDFDSFVEADRAARSLAEAHQGKTFVVFKPEEAYRASAPKAERVFLSWANEVDLAEPPQVASEAA